MACSHSITCGFFLLWPMIVEQCMCVNNSLKHQCCRLGSDSFQPFNSTGNSFPTQGFECRFFEFY